MAMTNEAEMKEYLQENERMGNVGNFDAVRQLSEKNHKTVVLLLLLLLILVVISSNTIASTTVTISTIRIIRK